MILFSTNQASLLSFLPSGPNYWIGLADLANEGVYKWQTGYNAAEYTFWAGSQPDGLDGEDCVELVSLYSILTILALCTYIITGIQNHTLICRLKNNICQLYFQCADGWFWCDWECYSAYSSGDIEVHALCETANV